MADDPDREWTQEELREHLGGMDSPAQEEDVYVRMAPKKTRPITIEITSRVPPNAEAKGDEVPPFAEPPEVKIKRLEGWLKFWYGACQEAWTDRDRNADIANYFEGEWKALSDRYVQLKLERDDLAAKLANAEVAG